MYFIVFDHDVMADQYYVRMCRLLDDTNDNIEKFSTELDNLTFAGHYGNLLTSHASGTFINRYLLGFELTEELNSTLNFFVTEKLSGTSFTNTEAPLSWKGPWVAGWHVLLHCWSRSATSDELSALRTGWVSPNTPSPGAVCSYLANNDRIPDMYEAAVLILEYLIANNDKAKVRVITTKYPFAIPQSTSQSVNCNVCGTVLRDAGQAYKSLRNEILCDSCWYNYLHYPNVNQHQFNKAEFVVSIATGATDVRLYRRSDLKAFADAWKVVITHSAFVLSSAEIEAIVNSYNEKLTNAGFDKDDTTSAANEAQYFI